MSTFASEIRYTAEMANQKVENKIQEVIGDALERKIRSICSAEAELGALHTSIGWSYTSLPKHLPLTEEITYSYLKKHFKQLEMVVLRILRKLGLFGSVEDCGSYLIIELNWSRND